MVLVEYFNNSRCAFVWPGQPKQLSLTACRGICIHRQNSLKLKPKLALNSPSTNTFTLGACLGDSHETNYYVRDFKLNKFSTRLTRRNNKPNWRTIEQIWSTFVDGPSNPLIVSRASRGELTLRVPYHNEPRGAERRHRISTRPFTLGRTWTYYFVHGN